MEERMQMGVWKIVWESNGDNPMIFDQWIKGARVELFSPTNKFKQCTRSKIKGVVFGLNSR